MLRWIFFPISLLIQWAIVFPIYLVLIPIFWFTQRSKFGIKLTTNGVSKKANSLEEFIELAKKDTVRNDIYLDDTDQHNSLMHVALWSLRPEMANRGLKELMYPNGSLKRKYPDEQSGGISGDCLSAWVFTHQLLNGDKEDLKKVADHYIKNCFGLQATNENKTEVSDRCSNGGMNIVYDSPIKLSVPCFGPQYYTSAALLKYASKVFGGKYTLFYALNYILMGGWLFHFMPILYTKKNPMYYLSHITLINLVTMARLGSDTKRPIRNIIKDISPQGNQHPVFYSMAHLAKAITPEELEQTKEHLLYISHVWPQYDPVDQSFYDKDTKPDGDSASKPMYSLMAMCAKILKGEIK